MKPARQLVTRSPHRAVGAVHVPYIQDNPVEWESPLERAFVRIGVICRAVISIRHQPFKVEYKDSEGTARTYTPDFLVTLSDGSKAVVEIKKDTYVDQGKDLFDRVAEKVTEASGQYYVITNKMMPEDREDRACLYRRYGRSCPSESNKAQVLSILKASQGRSNWTEMKKQGVELVDLYHLVARREIHVSLETDIQKGAVISSPKLKEASAYDEFESWFGCAPWEKSQKNRGRFGDASKRAEA